MIADTSICKIYVIKFVIFLVPFTFFISILKSKRKDNNLFLKYKKNHLIPKKVNRQKKSTIFFFFLKGDGSNKPR